MCGFRGNASRYLKVFEQCSLAGYGKRIFKRRSAGLCCRSRWPSSGLEAWKWESTGGSALAERVRGRRGAAFGVLIALSASR